MFPISLSSVAGRTSPKSARLSQRSVKRANEHSAARQCSASDIDIVIGDRSSSEVKATRRVSRRGELPCQVAKTCLPGGLDTAGTDLSWIGQLDCSHCCLGSGLDSQSGILQVAAVTYLAALAIRKYLFRQRPSLDPRWTPVGRSLRLVSLDLEPPVHRPAFASIRKQTTVGRPRGHKYLTKNQSAHLLPTKKTKIWRTRCR